LREAPRVRCSGALGASSTLALGRDEATPNGVYGFSEPQPLQAALPKRLLASTAPSSAASRLSR
jgi:hypothetical protein